MIVFTIDQSVSELFDQCVGVIFEYGPNKAVCVTLMLFSQHQVNVRLYLKLCSVPAGGFYSQLVKPGLRVVSLNTILYYGPDKVTKNMTDPAGQFEWLEKTLEKAAQDMEKVYNFLSLQLEP